MSSTHLSPDPSSAAGSAPTKTTFRAHTDIAFIKYWGKKDEVLRLPENGSISMKLADLYTTTTVEFDPQLKQDVVKINGLVESGEELRVIQHLQRVRDLATQVSLPLATASARVVSNNNFPTGSGLSSSGSGFAALTLAATRAIGLRLSQKELSILARQGSGSACRAVCGGYVEWHDADTSEGSFSETLFPADHWTLSDVVVVVSQDRKTVGTSTAAHRTAGSSPFFITRLQRINQKILAVKTAIAEKNFGQLGQLIEAEALEFHSIMLTSQPAQIALLPGTIQVMHQVLQLRSKGIPCYFTLNTGHNIHVLTLPTHADLVADSLQQLPLVEWVVFTKTVGDPVQVSDHLL